MFQTKTILGYAMSSWLATVILPFILFSQVFAQTGAYWVGTDTFDEGAFVLCNDSVSEQIYVGGYKGDSTAFVLMDYSGHIIRQVCFKFLPNSSARELISDLKFNLAGTELIGTGIVIDNGSIGGYCFSMTPNFTVNWVLEFPLSGSFFAPYSIHEASPSTQHYILTGSSYPDLSAAVVQVDKANGNIVSGTFKNYNLGPGTVGSFYSSVVKTNGDIVGVGRFAEFGIQSSYRAGLVGIAPGTGNVLSSSQYMTQEYPAAVSRMYGLDLVLKGDTVISIGGGSFSGTNLASAASFLAIHDPLTLQEVQGYKIELSGFQGIVAREVIRSSYHGVESYLLFGDGKLSSGGSGGSFADQLWVLNMQRNGTVNWAKSYGSTNEEFISPGVDNQQQLIELSSSGAKYAFAASTKSFGSFDENILLVILDEEGEFLGTGECIGTDVVATITPQISNSALNISTTNLNHLGSPISPLGQNTNMIAKTICSPSVAIKPADHEIDQNQLSMFPLPTKGKLNLMNPFMMEPFEVKVFDCNGRLLIQEKFYSNESQFQFDLTKFSSGFYFVTAQSESGLVKSGKVLKE